MQLVQISVSAISTLGHCTCAIIAVNAKVISANQFKSVFMRSVQLVLCTYAISAINAYAISAICAYATVAINAYAISAIRAITAN